MTCLKSLLGDLGGPGRKVQLAQGLASNEHLGRVVIIVPSELGTCIFPVPWAGCVSCHSVRKHLGFWRQLRRKLLSNGGGPSCFQAAVFAFCRVCTSPFN